MTTAYWVAIGIVTLLVIARVLEVWLKRGKRRPLAQRMQANNNRENPELGLDAIDQDAMQNIIARNNELADRTGAGAHNGGHWATIRPTKIKDQQAYARFWARSRGKGNDQ